jgi:hypothetical protein
MQQAVCKLIAQFPARKRPRSNWRPPDRCALSVGGPGLGSGLVFLQLHVEEFGDGTEVRTWNLRHWEKLTPDVDIIGLAAAVKKQWLTYNPVFQSSRFTRVVMDLPREAVGVEYFRKTLKIPGGGVDPWPLQVVEARTATEHGTASKMDLQHNLALCLHDGTFKIPSSGREWSADLLKIRHDVPWGASDADTLPRSLALCLWDAVKNANSCVFQPYFVI